MILQTSFFYRKLTITVLDCGEGEYDTAKEIGNSLFNAIFSIHQACGYHSFSLTFFFNNNAIIDVFGPGYLSHDYTSTLIKLSESPTYEEYENNINHLIGLLEKREDFIPEQFSSTAFLDFIYTSKNDQEDMFCVENKHKLHNLIKSKSYKASLLPDFDYLIDNKDEAAELLLKDLEERGFLNCNDKSCALGISNFLKRIDGIEFDSPSLIKFSSNKEFYMLSNVLDNYGLYLLLSESGNALLAQRLLSFLSNYNTERREHRMLMIIHQAMTNNSEFDKAFSKIAPAHLLNKKRGVTKTLSGFEYIDLQATFN